MNILKYIIKRLLLAVLILFGVSIIVYALARCMPANYVEQTFSSALAQGTMQQEDVDHIMDLYGLSTPDAYLSVKVGEGSEYENTKFTKSAKSEIYGDVAAGRYPYVDWYKGNYNGPDNLRLTLKAETGSNGEDVYTFQISRVFSHGVVIEQEKTETDGEQEGEEKKEEGVIRINETVIPLEEGSFTILQAEDVSAGAVGKEGDVWLTITSRTITDEHGNAVYLTNLGEEVFVSTGKKGETLYHYADGTQYEGKASALTLKKVAVDSVAVALPGSYREATFWEKAGAILSGYFNWLFKLVQGDLGLSFKYKKPVAQVITENMDVSFMISFLATILQFAIAIPLGIKAATHQYGVVDYSVTILSMIGISLPTFFLASLFINLFCYKIPLFDPSGGLVGALSAKYPGNEFMAFVDMLYHMILPMLVLVILSIGGLMRYTRTNMLEVLNADYIRTARAKGVSEHTVVYKHAFRNTMIPLVTMMAGILPSLFGGAMITEQVFSIPGVGQMAYQALIVADVPFIMGYNMFLAIMTVLGTLLSDLMYAVVDPRVKIGG